MEQIYSENIRKILSNKKEIESSFNIKLECENNIITIEGSAEKEFKSLQFFEAINLGFSVNKALELRFDDIIFKQIRIKDISSRKNLSQIRARIIGKNRKVMDNLEFLSGCNLALHNNILGIIGYTEDLIPLEYALQNLISGSKHSAVFEYLEKTKKQNKP